MIPPPTKTLCSFHYYSRYPLDRLAATTIIGDSGAYSAMAQGAEINTAQLNAWGSMWKHRLAWLASLDVKNDVEATRRNWQEMVDAGIPGVPTTHVGDRPDVMDWYVEQGVDFMGLGGIVASSSAQAAIFRWLVSVFKYARDNHPQMRFHGWGVTREKFLRLPFFSVDSSGWGAAYRYARLALRHPHTGELVAVQLDGKDAYRPEVALLLRDHYGVSPSDVARSTPDNRLLMVKLCALSASVQEQQWRKLHRNSKLTPPQWGRMGGWNYGQPPPHQHIALNAKGQEYENDAVRQLNEGPHQHLAMTGRLSKTGDEDDAIRQLNDDGPHQHLVLADYKPHDGREGKEASVIAEMHRDGPHQHLALGGTGAGIREQKVFDEMLGPHQHLAEGSGEHLGVVNGLADGSIQ